MDVPCLWEHRTRCHVQPLGPAPQLRYARAMCSRVRLAALFLILALGGYAQTTTGPGTGTLRALFAQ
jgi:hypothetical protein